MDRYVHGYSSQESKRLCDQAHVLADLLHKDVCYPQGSLVLEAGCGTGCQTLYLAARNPHARFVSMDISQPSLEKARQKLSDHGLANVDLLQGDIYDLRIPERHFDHVFVCFVLEHLEDPVRALRGLYRVLKEEGTITVIEGDHGSFYCHPKSEEAMKAVECLIKIQALLGGDALIGRKLYPLLLEAGFSNPSVEPRIVYVDGSMPDMVEGFSRNTFTQMVRGVRDQALSLGLIDRKTWERGISDLEMAATDAGTFNYTFFKAIARRSAANTAWLSPS
jgi:ubiquinone/menaquinone biosynthesis C-methylase UbiE